MKQEPITATVVEGGERNHFMPDHFGNAFMNVENGVYTTLDKICDDYSGGYWQFIELSNGGGYMRLDTEQEQMHVSCENYFEGDLSPDAASIVACLYAINKAVWARPEDKNLNDHYYQLRDFALEHEECDKILGAID